MDLQNFSAPTMVEALQQVKTKMGHDAVILHTRTLSRRYWLGIRRREIVEITAARGLEVDGRRRGHRGNDAREFSKGFRGGEIGGPASSSFAQQPGLAAFGNVPYRSSQTPLHPSLQASPYLEAAGTRQKAYPTQLAVAPASAALPSRQNFLETPAAGNAAILGLSQDVSSLTSLVKSLVNEVRHKQSPQVPEELFCHYMRLIENHVAEEIAAEIVKAVCEQLRPDQRSQVDLVNERIAEYIEKLIPVAGPITRTKSTGPHIVALIGPTGVGKTTTLAKLAAILKLREHRRVGMITLDTFRLGAVEQLKKYADIIGCRIHPASSCEDLQQLLASMSDYEYILIDTAGRSPNDSMALNELKQLLASVGQNGPDEVHLVLSTTASQACVELAIARFSDVRVDRIIFTKLDEAAHVGVLLNVIRKVNKQLSYVTTGQNVPADIEVGRGRMLARRIVGSDA